MNERTNAEMVGMIRDQRQVELLIDVVQEDILKNWVAEKTKPVAWSELSLPEKIVTGPLIVSLTCYVLYFTLLFWMCDVVRLMLCNAVADVDPSARGTYPCLIPDADSVTTVDT